MKKVKIVNAKPKWGGLIIENGEQLEVNGIELAHLRSLKVIYSCPECKCFHINTNLHTEKPLTMDDIEGELKDKKIEEFVKTIQSRRTKVQA